MESLPNFSLTPLHSKDRITSEERGEAIKIFKRGKNLHLVSFA
jgi:hypothetical protein